MAPTKPAPKKKTAKPAHHAYTTSNERPRLPEKMSFTPTPITLRPGVAPNKSQALAAYDYNSSMLESAEEDRDRKRYEGNIASLKKNFPAAFVGL